MLALLRHAWLLALALALAIPAPAQELKPVPQLQSRVTDLAGMLETAQQQRLETILADYEKQTGSQIAILVVPSTAPESIEQYSIRVTDAWQLGRKGVDDGVLLVVAPGNPSALRRLRIEAGRGVQGVLTDAQSKRILQDTIAPYFRENHYYEGLVAGVGAIATLLNQEEFPAAPVQQRQVADDDGGGLGLFGIVMLVFAFSLVRSMFRPRRSHLSRGGWHSGATGFILGNIIGNMSRGGGGFGGGGFGGGFGGGGFSGGGGSFDGGGASGDW